MSYDFYDVTIKTSEVSEHWKSQVDSKPWKYFLEMYVLPQPLNSSVTLDKSMDTSLSDFSHWLSWSAFPTKTELSIARNSATITSVWQRFKDRQGNLLYASDKAFRSSFIYRKIRKMAPSKARKLKS